MQRFIIFAAGEAEPFPRQEELEGEKTPTWSYLQNYRCSQVHLAGATFTYGWCFCCRSVFASKEKQEYAIGSVTACESHKRKGEGYHEN